MSQKTAEFRFYEELNDFLEASRKKVTFKHAFNHNPAIKDVIESLGVPHTEIDLIIVNGKSVGFEHPLHDGDRVAVYPVFEALDITPLIHLRKKPLRNPQFILDVHLGKLARYLRLLGFDTIYDPHYPDPQIIAMAVEDKRIILTRDKGLLKNKNVTRGYWVRATDPDEQIQEILQRFDLFTKAAPFTRCLECNGTIVNVDKEKLVAQLETKTKQFYDKFTACSECKKIYWAGSHYQRMKQFVDHLISTAEKP